MRSGTAEPTLMKSTRLDAVYESSLLRGWRTRAPGGSRTSSQGI